MVEIRGKAVCSKSFFLSLSMGEVRTEMRLPENEEIQRDYTVRR
jgi:hypothetical protein